MTLQSLLFINSLKNAWKPRKTPEIYTNPIAVYHSVYKNLNPVEVQKIWNHFSNLICRNCILHLHKNIDVYQNSHKCFEKKDKTRC